MNTYAANAAEPEPKDQPPAAVPLAESSQSVQETNLISFPTLKPEDAKDQLPKSEAAAAAIPVDASTNQAGVRRTKPKQTPRKKAFDASPGPKACDPKPVKKRKRTAKERKAEAKKKRDTRERLKGEGRSAFVLLPTAPQEAELRKHISETYGPLWSTKPLAEIVPVPEPTPVRSTSVAAAAISVPKRTRGRSRDNPKQVIMADIDSAAAATAESSLREESVR